MQNADAECYGLLIDQSEQLVKDIVTQLISKARLRIQDLQPSMNQAKAGDQIDVSTTNYVNTNESITQLRQQSGQDGYQGQFDQFMFEPKSSIPLNLICTQNMRKEIDYLLDIEYHQLKEKQELKRQRQELLQKSGQDVKDENEDKEESADTSSEQVDSRHGRLGRTKE